MLCGIQGTVPVHWFLARLSPREVPQCDRAHELGRRLCSRHCQWRRVRLIPWCWELEHSRRPHAVVRQSAYLSKHALLKGTSFRPHKLQQCC